MAEKRSQRPRDEQKWLVNITLGQQLGHERDSRLFSVVYTAHMGNNLQSTRHHLELRLLRKHASGSRRWIFRNK